MYTLSLKTKIDPITAKFLSYPIHTPAECYTFRNQDKTWCTIAADGKVTLDPDVEVVGLEHVTLPYLQMLQAVIQKAIVAKQQ